MAKRFIDTGLYDDPWFMDLSLSGKVLWMYCITKCDHAGIFEMNERLCQFQTGIKSLQTVIKELGNRLIKVKEQYYFIPKFIDFQYPGFPKSNVRQQESAIKILSEFGLFDKENNTLIKELNNTYDNDSVSDNDTDNDFDNKKSCLLKNSGITIEDIKNAFWQTDDIKTADYKYYYNQMFDWSENGNKKKDWVATARSWARKDLSSGKLMIHEKFKSRL